MNTACKLSNVVKDSKLWHQKYTGFGFAKVTTVLILWYWSTVSGTFCKQKNGLIEILCNLTEKQGLNFL